VNLKNGIFSAKDPLYDTVCSVNKQLHSPHIININHAIYHIGFFGNPKNFKCASQLLLFELLHAAVLLSVRKGRSQMHYSLNTVSEIF